MHYYHKLTQVCDKAQNSRCFVVVFIQVFVLFREFQNPWKTGWSMLNIKRSESFIDSLKLTWIRRLQKSSGKLQIILNTYIDKHKLANCGADYISICCNQSTNTFQKYVFTAWKLLTDKENQLKSNTTDYVLKSSLWYIEKFKIGNKSILYKDRYKKAILIVNDLIKDKINNTFFSFQECSQYLGIQSDFLQFQCLITVVRRHLSGLNAINSNLVYTLIPKNLEMFFKNTKGAKDFYNILSQNDSIPTGRKKWEETFDFNNETWKEIYNLPFRVTKSTKLQWFQFRINYHILTTNSYLFKARLINSPMCKACHSETEYIIHSIWECEKVQIYFKQF